jgi:hypothetical protein
VAKKKHQVAPFEIVAGLGKSPSTRESQEGAAAGEEGQQEATAVPAEKPRRHVVPTSKPPASPYPTTPAASEVGEPGKLTVSMGHLTAGLIIGGAILLLVGAFVLGRMTAGPGDETTAGMNSQVDQPLKRVTGKYYMVIEATDGKTPADRMQAEHIVSFLESNNIRASVIPYGETRWLVLGYQAFPSPEDPAAREYAEKIDKLGTYYDKRYPGNYDFAPPKPGESAGPWFGVWRGKS